MATNIGTILVSDRSNMPLKYGKPESGESNVLEITYDVNDEFLKGFLACRNEVTAVVIDSRVRCHDFLYSDYFYFVLGNKPNIFWVDVNLHPHSPLNEQILTEKLDGIQHHLIIQCGSLTLAKVFVKEPGKDVVILDLNDPPELITEDELLVKLLQKDSFGVPLLVGSLKQGLIGEFGDKPNTHRSLADVTLRVEKAFGRKNPDLSVATLLDYTVFHDNFLCTRLLWSLSSHEWEMFSPNDKDSGTLEIAAKYAGPEVLAVFLGLTLPLDKQTLNEKAVGLLDASQYCERNHPLLTAVREGRDDNVKFFMNCGVDVNVVDGNGKGALEYAIEGERWGIVVALLENGACVGRLTSEDKELVLVCVTRSNLEVDSNDVNCSACKILYDTIRVNNVELVETLDRKWREDYCNDPVVLQRMDKCLRKVYDELRWKRVPLSDEMEVFIESRLINLHFLVGSKGKEVKTRLGDVQFRMEMIVRCASELRTVYAGRHGRDVDEKFLFKAQFVACNIHVLKRQLKSTFDKLPWEEIEFCIAIFITSLTRHGEFDAVYKMVLDKERLLSHLGNFSEELDRVRQRVANTDVNNKFPDQVDKIELAANPLFTALYSDHALIRNVYSLRHVESCVNVALSVDIEGKPELGKLVIERTLQILGESLKNSLDSPNVSEDVQQALLYTAPKNVRDIVTVLRDSLSHSHALARKMSFQEGKDMSFFLAMQNDLRKISLHIGKILYTKKCDALKIFVNKIQSCENLADIEKLVKGFDVSEFDRAESGSSNMTELAKMKELIRQLQDVHKDLNVEDKESFRKLEEIVISQETAVTDVKFDYCRKAAEMTATIRNGLKIGQGLSSIQNMCVFNMCNDRSRNEMDLLHIFPVLPQIHLKLNTDMANKKRLKDLFRVYKDFLETINFQARQVQGIGEFQGAFQVKDSELGKNAEEVLYSLLREIQEKAREAEEPFRAVVDSEREAWEAKMKLIPIFIEEVHIVQVDLDSLPEYQSLKEETKRKLRKAFDKHEWDRCKEILEGRDSYKTLLNSVRNCLQEKKHDMSEYFTGFLNAVNLKKVQKERVREAIVSTFQDKGQMLERYFEKRLDILGRLLPSSAVEAVALCKRDKGLLMAVEMLVLDLSELLDSLGRFADNRLFLDKHSPLLLGKVLRNYLAHGDALVDCLPFDPSTAVVLSAVRLISEGKALLTVKDGLIGGVVMENHTKQIDRYEKSLGFINNQDRMFDDAKMGDLKEVNNWIGKGAEAEARDVDGRTVSRLLEQATDLAIVKFGADGYLDAETKDCYSRNIVDVAVVPNGDLFFKSPISFAGLEKMALHVSAVFGVKDDVIMLINAGTDVNLRDEDDRTPLMLATMKGHMEVVDLLAHNGGRVDAVSKGGMTPMHFAAECNHVKVMEVLLRRKGNVNAMTKDGWTPLHFAANYGHKLCAGWLLEHGAKVEFATRDTWLPLHLAAMCGSKEIIEMLVNKGAKVDAPSDGGWTSLHCAAVGGFKDSLIALLDREGTVDVKTHKGCTPLHCAAASGHMEAALTLLERGANVDNTNNRRETALLLATCHRHLNVVKALLRRGANPDVQNHMGETALHFAAVFALKDIAESLLEFSAALNVQTYDEWLMPLHYATGRGQAEMVLMLLGRGAEIDAATREGRTVLHLAADYGFKRIVKAALDGKADINAVDADGASALHNAAYFGHRNIVELLVERGAEVDLKDNDNCSPVTLAAQSGSTDTMMFLLGKLSHDKERAFLAAAQYGQKDVVDLLLKVKVDVNARNDLGDTALCCAARFGNGDVVEILLGNLADIEAQAKSGKTALHLAAMSGHKDVVVILLENGGNVLAKGCDSTVLHSSVLGKNVEVVRLILNRVKEVLSDDPSLVYEWLNAGDKYGDTPLMWAVLEGNVDAVEVMLEYVDVACGNGSGMTALHMAAHGGSLDIVELLLGRGACVNDLDNNGNSALGYAARSKKWDVVELLVEGGAEGLVRVHVTVVDLWVEMGGCVQDRILKFSVFTT